MQLLELTPEQIKLAQEAVAARFINNSVAYQCIPIERVKIDETTIRWDRYDYERSRVVDNESLSLPEPYAEVNFTRSQKDELDMKRAMTTIHRKTSELTRFFDAMAFVGLQEAIKNKTLTGVVIPDPSEFKFISLREAAIQVEEEEGREPILVDPSDSQESLVSSGFQAVFKLEEYGYYSNYFSVWGEHIWALLNKPEQHDSVRPKEILQDTIQDFYRSSTLPPDEAIVVSLDGPTLKYIIATEEDSASSENNKLVFFEPFEIETDSRKEQIYKYQVKFRAVPCVQEIRSIVRIKLAPCGAI
ncbi:hypothetical protein SAMN05216302_101844 [Nitrosomonas aestuarii]|uniref:Phage major capsid protein E n=1 Tax=Nitrosomonas aestuarii TaxID=52441 RepID=A0A1I4D4S3_9PROT|nr:hypothetical protein [Nitrosomonas aestuarii]SFK87146.1 hypothetical protein SAMN05216302_101844 [Nitrosomonas aestuarii]